MSFVETSWRIRAEQFRKPLKQIKDPNTTWNPLKVETKRIQWNVSMMDGSSAK